MAEVRRLIREVDPPRPSARLKTLDGNELTTMAKRRHTDAAKLPNALRGDIDWIVMKCLEKDRKRRYDTANGLAVDLQRHLRNDVVMARPPTTAYLLSKLVRRNKLAFAAAGAIAASLVIGIAGSVWQAVRATHNEQRAVQAERRATATLDELRATAPAFAEQARALAAREQFDEAIGKLDYAIKLRPDVAEYLVAKGDLLQCQLKLAQAVAVYREALRVRPDVARAAASAKLCEELLAAPAGNDGKLTRESLAKLSLAMQEQQRPAGELMPVARLLGEEKRLVLDYWLARLKDLPVSAAERALKDRLSVRDDGRLGLDLSGTKVIDLSPLTGAPLAGLDVSKCKELSDLSPLREMSLVELNAGGTSVGDLGALRAMHTLEKLDVSGSRVSDLSALSALRLKRLGFSNCPISDLTPIRQMPLEEISLRETRVSDLSPLVGMPIKSIDLSMAPVLDFSALARLPLERCFLQHNRIADLSVLRDKPLKELVLWGCVEARNYRAIASIKTLELVLLPSEYRELPAEDYDAIGSLRNLPKLRQMGSEIMNQMGYGATGSKDAFWQDWDREQSFVPALRKAGIRFALTKLPAGTYWLWMSQQPLRDLSLLKGAPISHLSLVDCQVTDLTPIHDLPLEYLNVPANPISDLGPLRGTQINTLYLTGTKVSDVSPLSGLPLKALYLGDCAEVTDVAPLAGIGTLENLVVPIQGANIEALRKLPKLQRMGFRHTDSDPFFPDTTAADFWQQYSSNGWIAGLRAAGVRARSLTRLADGTWDVDLDGSTMTDLTVLQGAPISRLDAGDTAIADLKPLQGMALKRLVLWKTRVTDLSALQGMPLEELVLDETAVSDLSSLQGMPLRILHFSGTRVSDLAPLMDMPLTSLRMHDCRELTDLGPLAKMKSLREVTLPPRGTGVDFLREFSNIQRLSYKAKDLAPDETAAEFWRDYQWQRALRTSGFEPKELTRFDDGTWLVKLDDSGISDVSILRNAPISELWLMNDPVSDLSPLRGMPLRKLGLYHTKVTDLTPLRGMRLEVLNLVDTKVTDISVLRGMPLTNLRLHNCGRLSDVSPLAEARGLVTLTLPAGAKEIEFLRGFGKLERISYFEESKGAYRPTKTAAEFWKEYDAKRE
jgi:Leucine-rich repeat (LRR) protein/tetratricopeptide (TPR) repeat protein